MSLPGKYNITLARGKDFSIGFAKKVKETGAPIDLTGWKVRCQIRTADGQFGTTTATSLLINMPNNGGVSIEDAPLGKVRLVLTALQTQLLCPLNERTVVSYEVELYNDTTPPEMVNSLMQGRITVLPETAR